MAVFCCCRHRCCEYGKSHFSETTVSCGSSWEDSTFKRRLRGQNYTMADREEGSPLVVPEDIVALEELVEPSHKRRKGAERCVRPAASWGGSQPRWGVLL